MNAPMDDHNRKAATNSPISGTTKLFGILGTPVAQVKSPGVWNELFLKSGIDAVFLPFDAPIEKFDDVIRGLKGLSNVDGFIITMPHKAASMKYVEHLSTHARRIGAISMMRRNQDGTWTGESCESEAFMMTLRQASFSPVGKSAFLIGAGGAGQVIGWTLAEHGVTRLGIHDVDLDKAADLAKRISKETGTAAGAVENKPSGYDLVVNATPIGMKAEDSLPTDISQISAHAFILDMVVDPCPTRFVSGAIARGHAAANGLQVLRQTVPVIAKFMGLEFK